MRKAISRISVVALVVALLAIGCAGTQQNQATKGMLVTQTAIVDIATSADQLCTAGILTQPQCTEIGTAYDKAKVYYDLAETALSAAIKADNDGAWKNYEIVHQNFGRIYGDLLAVALKHGITPEGGN